MTLIQSLNISRESLVNNQYALTVVSQNVANINTEGYSRQRANFEAINNTYPGSSVASVIYGLGGAKIADIESYANSALNTNVRTVNSESEYYNQLATMMGNIETIIDQLGDDGLLSDFSTFYEAAENLSNSPADSSTRQSFYIAAKNLCSEFNYLATTLTDQKNEIAGNYLYSSTAQDSLIAVNVDAVNQKLEELASVNAKLTQMSSDNTGTKNNFIDKRDAILEELSSYIPMTTKENEDSTVTVMLGTIGLVKGSTVVNELAVASGETFDTPIKIQAVNTDNGLVSVDNLNSAFGTNGIIGAQLAMVTTSEDFISINTLLNQLDNLANNFSATMNEVQTYEDGDIKACYLTKDSSGNMILSDETPPDMFEGVGAMNIKLTDAIKNDYNKIAAARVDTSTTDWNKNVGNSTNALTMAEYRNEYVVDSTGTTPAGTVPTDPDATTNEYLISISTKFAAQLNDVNSKNELNQSLLDAAVTQRDSVTSVNLDEELADMIKYQRAYEASAKVFSAANEIMQVLITLGG